MKIYESTKVHQAVLKGGIYINKHAATQESLQPYNLTLHINSPVREKQAKLRV